MADKRLWHAIDNLVKWQKETPNPDKRCLEAVRYALKKAGVKLPMSTVDYYGSFAIDCGKTLAAKPERWGWKLLGTTAKALPTDGQPCLVFFRGVGWIPRRMKWAGHIAIYKPSTNRHISNASYGMSLYWKLKIAFVFELMP